jgi:hypothetical protein
MMKCLECSYSTDDKDKKFCPYDGSELVDSEANHTQTQTEDITEGDYEEG